MHILNNGTHALVFPPRCGTRWIAEKLYHKNLINTFGPSHDFKYDSSADVKIFMFVRNPFTRERSVYRWLIETKQIKLEDLSFEQYINGSWFDHEPSYYDRYGEFYHLVEHVHLEKIDDFFVNELNIKIEEYDNSYHNVNDGIEDLHAYTEQMKQKVLTKYKHEIELIGFVLTSYV